MRDIRLEEFPFEFEGKTYILRCNMNVLADVQDAFGGDLGAALRDDSPARSVLEFLAAMMNDYADDMGWQERFTAKKLGRKFPSITALPAAEVFRLVTKSITPAREEDDQTVEENMENRPEDSGN